MHKPLEKDHEIQCFSATRPEENPSFGERVSRLGQLGKAFPRFKVLNFPVSPRCCKGLFTILPFLTRSRVIVLQQNQSSTSPTQPRNSNSTYTNRIPLPECTIRHTRVLVATRNSRHHKGNTKHKQAIARYSKAKRTKKGTAFGRTDQIEARFTKFLPATGSLRTGTE